MNWLILILMVTLPFSSLFIHINNIWVSHGTYFQFGILCLFSYTLFNSPKSKVSNIPLTSLFLWLGLITMLWWNMEIVATNQYNFIIFMPFFNLLCFILFYKAIVEYLNEVDIDRILRWLSYVVGIMAVYGILQQLNLDQFHKHFNTVGIPDAVVGTIGNPIHFASWLSICLPILYYAKTKFRTLFIILTWIVLLLTGSLSGIGVAILITLFYNAFFGRFKQCLLAFIILGSLSFIGLCLKGFNWTLFLSNSGRFEFWKSLYSIFAQNPIVGGGFGKILSLGNHWKHVHNEPYQIAIEGGLIGLGLAVWCIVEYFKKFIQLEKSKLSICLCSMFVAFLLLSMVNFTCHLYLTGILGLFAYAGIYCIKGAS